MVSSALLDQVPDRAEFAFDDLGKLSLKNLTQPVRGFALSVPGSARADLRRPADEPKAARLPAIAVLPFAHLSSDVQDGYFAEGFADDIIVTLGNIPELVVVSRGSTIPFRRRPVDPGEVSEKLGVRYVLSGSVRRTQNRIRISVELVDAVDASVVWAERYDEPIDEVFNLQDEIAIRIVGKIATYVRRAELQRALRKPPQSLNAYDWLLRGLDLLYRLDFGSLAQARTCLERARDEDRDYSAPYAFLAHWHMFAIAEGWASGTEAGLGEVVRLAQCAVERDPCNALAVAIEGHARAMFFRDYDAGIELCDRATAISPNNSWAWVFSSGPYGFVGDPRMGIARAERAIRLAPLGQQAFFNYTLLAQNQYLAGSFGDAVRWSRKALHLNPRFGNAARVLAASLVASGQGAEAGQVGALHRRMLPSFRVSDYARRCPFEEPQASRYVARLRAAASRTETRTARGVAAGEKGRGDHVGWRLGRRIGRRVGRRIRGRIGRRGLRPDDVPRRRSPDPVEPDGLRVDATFRGRPGARTISAISPSPSSPDRLALHPRRSAQAVRRRRDVRGTRGPDLEGARRAGEAGPGDPRPGSGAGSLLRPPADAVAVSHTPTP